MAPNDLTPCRMAFYFVSTFAIAQTPTKQPALRLSRTKNLHFAKAPFPGFSAAVVFKTWEKDVIERRLRPELLAIEWQQELSLKDGQLSVLDMAIAPIPIAMATLKSGRLLLSKNISRQLQEQQRIMSKWEIDYLYHYQNQQAIYG